MPLSRSEERVRLGRRRRPAPASPTRSSGRSSGSPGRSSERPASGRWQERAARWSAPAARSGVAAWRCSPRSPARRPGRRRSGGSPAAACDRLRRSPRRRRRRPAPAPAAEPTLQGAAPVLQRAEPRRRAEVDAGAKASPKSPPPSAATPPTPRRAHRRSGAARPPPASAASVDAAEAAGPAAIEVARRVRRRLRPLRDRRRPTPRSARPSTRPRRRSSPRRCCDGRRACPQTSRCRRRRSSTSCPGPRRQTPTRSASRCCASASPASCGSTCSSDRRQLARGRRDGRARLMGRARKIRAVAATRRRTALRAPLERSRAGRRAGHRRRPRRHRTAETLGAAPGRTGRHAWRRRRRRAGAAAERRRSRRPRRGKPRRPKRRRSPSPRPAATLPAPAPGEIFEIPSIPSSSCAASGVPPVLIPIYQRAAADLRARPAGPRDPGRDQRDRDRLRHQPHVSSAGAVGWMQFMPATWAGLRGRRQRRRRRRPLQPRRRDLRRGQLPAAPPACRRTPTARSSPTTTPTGTSPRCSPTPPATAAIGAGFGGGFALTPQLQVLSCSPAAAWREKIPTSTCDAFEDAAARYELGRRGVWALAAVARLESNFGRGMSKDAAARARPARARRRASGSAYAVDGDEDGHIRRADPADSAATLARLIWSRGGLRAGIFTHNQAQWYVRRCSPRPTARRASARSRTVDWPLALPERGRSRRSTGTT